MTLIISILNTVVLVVLFVGLMRLRTIRKDAIRYAVNQGYTIAVQEWITRVAAGQDETEAIQVMITQCTDTEHFDAQRIGVQLQREVRTPHGNGRRPDV